MIKRKENYICIYIHKNNHLGYNILYIYHKKLNRKKKNKTLTSVW